MNLPCPTGLNELPVFRENVVVHLEQKIQRVRDVLLCNFAEIRRERMGRFSDQRAEFELAADFQKFVRTLIGSCAHGGGSFPEGGSVASGIVAIVV